MLDPLGVVTKTRQDIGEQEHDGLTEAPSSIAQNEEIKRQAVDNYFYVPTIGLVPEIMAPSSLPDLTGKIGIFSLIHKSVIMNTLNWWLSFSIFMFYFIMFFNTILLSQIDKNKFFNSYIHFTYFYFYQKGEFSY